MKQIVADKNGVVWIATWNGLNRFDGYDFTVIRPSQGEQARRYSSRFRDIRTASDGRLWCRIDDRLVRVDPSTNRFEDIHTLLEERFGRSLSLKYIRQSTGADTLVMICDGCYVTVPDAMAVDGAELQTQAPDIKFLSISNRKLGDFGPYRYEDQALGRSDSLGHVWIVTKKGVVAFAPDRESEPVEVKDLQIPDGTLNYSFTDSEGGHWFRSSQGAHYLSLGTLPYQTLEGSQGERVLAAVIASDGRIWVAEPSHKAVAIYQPDLKGEPMYLNSSGRLTKHFATCGVAVYSMAVTNGGTLWLGSKPDGLYRLTPTGVDSYRMEQVCPGNIYDITPDPSGRLWIATLGDGVKRIDNPDAETVTVEPLPGYPADARSARRVVVQGDSLIIAATTGGLLAVSQTDNSKMQLHVTEADRLNSLGCIAVTDIARMPDGKYYIATESDGINTTSSPLLDQGVFTSLNDRGSNNLDVALALCPFGSSLLTVGPGHIYALNADSTALIYGDAYWHTSMHFAGMRPLPLPDGRLLIGTQEGAIVTSLHTPSTHRRLQPAPLFTSATIQGRGDTLLTASTSELTLRPNERTLTLNFACPVYSHPSDIRYSVRINGGEWSKPGTSRSLTLYDLNPGDYVIEVRNTDHMGRLNPSSASLTLHVTPKFHETILAKILLWLLIILVSWGCVRIWLYIKAIKRKQQETLEAYLSLINRTSPPDGAADEQASTPPATPEISDADDTFMRSVMEYVSSRLDDPEAGVDDMAAAVGVSRSSLARKMKSLMGVSAAEFVRRTRMSHAARLLTTTTLPVKEVAWQCGFTDLNYFGKCFKSAHGSTPTAYREERRGEN